MTTELSFSIIEIFLYFSTGAVAGLLAGLLGVGGGLFIVPVLLFLLPMAGVDSPHLMTICVASSLTTIVITSISSIFAHHKRGAIRWPVFLQLTPGITLGAILGAVIADQVSQMALKNLFAISVIMIAFKMLVKFTPASETDFPSKGILGFVSTSIGCLSSMLGIGGGALTVPVLKYWKVPMVNAVATSAACGLPLAIAGTLGFIFTGLDQISLPNYSSGYVYWPAVFGIIITSVLFAPLGAKFAHAISAPLLSRLFAFFLMMVGIKMLLI